MLNDPCSHGLWEITAPQAPSSGSLAATLTADVLIIGAGFTGCSAALHLAEKGVRAVVLEAVEVGFGGAGRNVGLVNAGMWVLPSALTATLGEDYGDRLLTILGNGPQEVFRLINRLAIPCEAQPVGTLHCAVGAKGLEDIERRQAEWSARGAPVELLNAAQASAKIGTDVYRGALWDKRAGTIQPLAYVRGLAGHAIAAGAKIFTNSPVRSLDQQGSQWTATTTHGSVTAPWVVMATDAYTHLNGPWPVLRREQVHLPYFNCATTPLSPDRQAAILPERQGCWDTRTVMHSFRFDQGGRLVFGSIGSFAGTGHAVHHAWAKRAVAAVFPALRGVEFEAEWYGKIGLTSDNLPRFHKLAPGVISFSGYNGRGISPGTVFGRVIAEHITGALAESDLPLPLTAPQDARWQKTQEAFYALGAQAAHLAPITF